MGLLVLTGTLGFAVARGAATGTAPEDAGQVVRANSRVLSQAPDEKAQLVEFLDFECEACLAAHPFVEELRREHGDTVTVIHRYFPMPGHRNAMNAAIAVEAAAQQGKYAAMHRKMFRTQTQWGGSAEDKSALFRSFAQDLGLDLAAYDRAVADPATADRIRLDKADGLALGISGTPTFFLNGEPLVADSLEEFRALVEKAAQRP
ncbi:thioredoxin domain-containing protein [Arthrobacter sp. E918]|uniref:Thioredoxin domain-containing protein n=2 Tax=Arthrobacter mobilis TaxID=2724944 RepID=A0A7X6HDG5_9MICC|nr:thioredoxin domain-containing protein [Arthrobacter mobilis]NKX55099.1 thioredoxin domain-containing protein [Arthrobacter mobilis]